MNRVLPKFGISVFTAFLAFTFNLQSAVPQAPTYLKGTWAIPTSAGVTLEDYRSQAVLVWDAVPEAEFYRVYRFNPASAAWLQVADGIQSRTFREVPPAADAHDYAVAAVNANGESPAASTQIIPDPAGPWWQFNTGLNEMGQRYDEGYVGVFPNTIDGTDMMLEIGTWLDPFKFYAYSPNEEQAQYSFQLKNLIPGTTYWYRLTFADASRQGFSYVSRLSISPPEEHAQDFWDTSSGATVLGASKVRDGFDARDAFGGAYSEEPGQVAFDESAGDGYAHYLEWKTVRPFRLSAFEFYASGDGVFLNNQLDFRQFVLKAKLRETDEYETIYTITPSDREGIPDSLVAAGHWVTLPAMVDAQFFRAEFVQRGAGRSYVGPRVIELDGYGFEAPGAVEQSVSLPGDFGSPITLTANNPDNDPLVFEVVSAPSNGTLSGVPPNLIYTPAPGFAGTDAFEFSVRIGNREASLAWINITVLPTISPSHDDLWDVSNGVIMTGTSGIRSGFVWSDIFGSSVSALEPGQTIFADGRTNGYTHFLEWRTPAPIVLTGFDLFALGQPTSQREFGHFVLKAKRYSTDEFATVYTYTPSHPYSFLDPRNHALISAELPEPVEAQFFRAEFVQRNAGFGSDGPRVIELDGFGSIVADEAPVAVAESVSLQEDMSVPITLIAEDPDGGLAVFEIVSPPAHGTLHGVAPNLTYTPNANYFGTDTLLFSVSNGSDTPSEATVSIQVTAVNDPPTADSISATVGPAGSVDITLSGSDVENSPLTFNIVTPPSNGTLSGAAPYLLYTAGAAFGGTATFAYTVSDGEQTSAPATVSIAVSFQPSGNDLWDISNGVVMTATSGIRAGFTWSDMFGTSLSPLEPGHTIFVDGRADGYTHYIEWQTAGPISLTGFNLFAIGQPTSQREFGQFVLKAKKHSTNEFMTIFTFTPTHPYTLLDPVNRALISAILPEAVDAQFFRAEFVQRNAGYGSDGPRVIELDGFGSIPMDDSPIALAQSVSMDEDSSAAVTLTAENSDGGVEMFEIVSAPAHGTLSGTPPNMTYTPSPNFFGADSLRFSVSNGNGTKSEATVSIEITGVNDAPTADSLSALIGLDGSAAIVLSGSDVENSAMTYHIVNPPANGTLSGIAPNLVFTAAAGFTKTTSFTYTVSDGELTSAPATVTISVPLSPSSEDLWDISNGVVMTGTSGVRSGFVWSDMFGSSLSLLERGHTVFTDGRPEGYSHYIEWQTAAPITLTGFNLFAVGGGPAYNNEREFAQFILKAKRLSADEFTTIYTFTPSHPYTILDPASRALLSADLPDGIEAQFFRAEFVQRNGGRGFDGPRIVELDGFGTVATDDVPVALDQSISMLEDSSATITLTATDPDGGPAVFEVVAGPAFGTLSGSVPNLIYTPNPNFSGSDSMRFSVSNEKDAPSEAVIFINAIGVNDAPVANSFTATTEFDTPLAVTLAGMDIESSPLSYSIVSVPANGALSGSAPNLVFIPNTGFSGITSFTYTVNDGELTSTPATVTITINPQEAQIALHYSFDELSGGTVLDRSGNGNIGILRNNPSWVPGIVGAGALRFPQANDFVEVGAHPALDNLELQGNGGMTIAFWLSPDSLSNSYLLTRGINSASTMKVSINTSGRLSFVREFSGSSNLNLRFNNQVTVGQWQHFVLTWDGTGALDSVRLFKNGAPCTLSFGNAGQGDPRSDAGQALYLGGMASYSGFNGSLDEVRFYNRVLSAAEIAELAASR